MAITTSGHRISFLGLAGSAFICTVISLVFYIIAFGTSFWLKSGEEVIKRVTYDISVGLWESCVCFDVSINDGWFKGVKAMITIGLIGLIICLVFISLYMCVHSISKNTTIIIFVVVAFIAVAFMVIGFIIIGTNTKGNDVKYSWSLGLAVMGAIFCLVAGILGIVQKMRSSGV